MSMMPGDDGEDLRIDFTGVQVGDFEPIPKGWYAAKVTNYEVRTSGEQAKNPGAKYINWELTISGGEYDGRKQWLNTSLLPQALFALKGLLAATGNYTDEDLEGSLDFSPADVKGCEVDIKVGMKKYEGEDRNDIKQIKPLGTGQTASADSSGGSLLP